MAAGKEMSAMNKTCKKLPVGAVAWPRLEAFADRLAAALAALGRTKTSSGC
jgi:hypothetical protein